MDYSIGLDYRGVGLEGGGGGEGGGGLKNLALSVGVKIV